MSIGFDFYTFAKRPNSTKTPTGAGSTRSCNFKDQTSIISPTITLAKNDFTLTWNYCRCLTLNRYYFIKDARFNRGEWEIDLECDVLGSYKSGIGAMEPYVLRSASQSDEYILDSAYPADSYVTEFISNPSSDITSGGYLYPSAQKPFSFRDHYAFVLGIIGAASGAIGSVTYYLMNQTQLNIFMGYLFGMTSTWSDISTSDYSDGVQRALLNPMQYITSCIMVPVDHSVTTYDDNTIKFGTYEYTGTQVAKKLDATAGSIVTECVTICRLPSHPQASTRGKYLNGAPYSKYWLHLGPYGDIPLNGNLGDLITTAPTDEARYISTDLIFDLASGICQAIVYPGLFAASVPFSHSAASTSKRLATVSFQAGVPIQLAQAYTDPLAIQEAQFKLAGNAISAVAGGVTNPVGAFAGALSSIPSGVGDIMRAQYPTVSANGSNGCAIQGYLVDEGIYIRSEHNRIVSENNTDLGRPLCQVKKINTLSGFILCSGADFSASGTADEREKINSYLNTGFYYE